MIIVYIYVCVSKKRKEKTKISNLGRICIKKKEKL